MTKRTAIRRISALLNNIQKSSPLMIINCVEMICLTYIRGNWEPPKSEDLTEKVAKNLGYEVIS